MRPSAAARPSTRVSQAEVLAGQIRGILFVLVVLTCGVFLPALRFGFINLDDDAYVTANPVVQAGLTWQGLVWAFTTMHVSNWHPLTWLSHMLDCQLFGLRGGLHHMMNIALHALSVAMLFLALVRMTGALWRSALAAALFAVHPLHVESVAWIAERKDVLSGLMWMLALIAYARYAERPGRARYSVMILLFVLGLLSKPMVVTLPVVLVLLDYWPLRRIAISGETGAPGLARAASRLVVEKVPLLMLSAASCAITVIAQHRGGALASTEMFPFPVRLTNAAFTYAAYIGKTCYPRNLAVPYPHPGFSLSAFQVAGAASVLVLLTVLFILSVRRFPYLLVGWLWYLVTLLPVIGLVQVGSQAMADRYMYLPSIGLFIMFSWGLWDIVGWLTGVRAHERAPLGFSIAAGVTVLVLSFVAAVQVHYWRDSATLFWHTLQVTEHNSIAHNNFGTALMEQSRFQEAAEHFSKSVETGPNNVDAQNNLGVSLLLLGRPEEAAGLFEQVLERTPLDATVHSNLGVALMQQGNEATAREHLTRALEIDPNCAKAREALKRLSRGKR